MHMLDLAWHAVHDPLEVDPEYTALYEGKIEDTSRRVLAGMISNLDQGVANVTDALKQKGMWKNTVWIMTTDNGEIHQMMSALYSLHATTVHDHGCGR